MASLREKIDIIYNYDPSFVPEYKDISSDASQKELEVIHRQAIERARNFKESHRQKTLESMGPLFDFIENQSDPILLLTSIQGIIKVYIEPLEKLKFKTKAEQDLLDVCNEILSLNSNNTSQLFPLFKKYTNLLIDCQYQKLPIPEIFDRAYPEIPLSCLII